MAISILGWSRLAGLLLVVFFTRLLLAAPTFVCPGTLDPHLVVGLQGRVVAAQGLVLRGGAGLDFGMNGTILRGDAFDVVGGPVCADDMTWWQVVVEGRGGWIAEAQDNRYLVEPIPGVSDNPPIYYLAPYRSTSALFRANADGTGWRYQPVVTGVYGAQVSADGQTIGVTGQAGLSLISPRTDPLSDPKGVEVFVGEANFPRWSPDFKQVAFGQRTTNDYDLYLLTVGDPEPERLTDEVGDAQYVNWSPDGQRIVYVVSRYDGTSRQLMLFDLQSGESESLYSSGEGLLFPAWSPDGQHIGFSDRVFIRILNMQSREMVSISIPDVASVVGPVWSPDGSRIAFQVMPAAQQTFSTYIMRADGSGQPVIIPPDPLDVNPASQVVVWSPDSSQLIYSDAISSPAVLINADGTGRVPIITDRAALPVAWLANPPPL